MSTEERELEIICPHCGDLTYEEVDLTFQNDVKNETDCTECGETFKFKFETEIQVKNLQTFKE